MKPRRGSRARRWAPARQQAVLNSSRTPPAKARLRLAPRLVLASSGTSKSTPGRSARCDPGMPSAAHRPSGPASRTRRWPSPTSAAACRRTSAWRSRSVRPGRRSRGRRPAAPAPARRQVTRGCGAPLIAHYAVNCRSRRSERGAGDARSAPAGEHVHDQRAAAARARGRSTRGAVAQYTGAAKPRRLSIARRSRPVRSTTSWSSSCGAGAAAGAAAASTRAPDPTATTDSRKRH